MKKTYLILFLSGILCTANAQEVMTPKQLLELNRVSAVGLTKDLESVVYRSSKYDILANKRATKYYILPVTGGEQKEIKDYSELIGDKHISPDGINKIAVRDVKINKVTGEDLYPELKNTNVKVYTSLQYRHWDSWEDGAFSHLFIEPLDGRKIAPIDVMAGEPYDCPQMPFGGDEDYLWGPKGKTLLYVTKKLQGTAYTQSTNTDIYEYNLETRKTSNLTENNKGYDTSPAFSSKGVLAWLQMKRDGYESDKNDIIVLVNGKPVNLTANWDGTVNGFIWSNDGSKIYFNAPIGGTVHLFELKVTDIQQDAVPLRQITKGQFDVNGVVGHNNNTMVVYRRDMNHASELYTVDLSTGEMKQLTHENDETYAGIVMGEVTKRMVKTTDGKEMVTWVIYPPNFDKTKKYPTLLYCQGGPQGALSQFYSFRWNFQVMAAQGYIIVAPNRRGMPGYGVEWNEQISGDYGGQNMQDYLSAIDDVAKESYVDNDRLGCVGASYGGYSCFYLAGIHEKRFKTFIAHDGIFNWKSMYGTTEEMFFVNWDMGGNYWDKTNKVAQRSFTEFNPVEKVDKWDTPIMIVQGGKDYRVPIGQGLEAFNAAQLRGIKSKLLFFPEENHWVLSIQNALVWQKEFFKWLEETL
jgi:dipeptidyl aminopeptidase/acylaminoacyl peptidase